MSDQSLSKEELWKLRIKDYRNSGLIAGEWCINNQFSLSQLRYWIHQMNKKQSRNEENSKPIFAELPVLASPSFLGSAPVTIYMGTIRIEIMDSCNFDLLSSLIGILSNHA